MIDRLRQLKRILTPAVGVALFLGIAGTTAVSFAQTPAPKITSVTPNTVTNTAAEITFSTDIAANAKIFYGPTTAYGTASPAINYTTPATTSHALTLDNLAPATTYHYQIEVKNGAGTTKSADRSFTTRSGTSSAGPLVLNNIVADCVDTRCQILFTPNRAATVRLVWDVAQHANFDDFPAANIVADNGVASAARRALVIPSQVDANNDGRPDVEFAPGTIYYYRLQAFEAGSPQPTLTTNTLQFTTSTNADDHTFSTGGCTLPNGTTIGIGQCGDSGYYCPSGGGEAVQDCTRSCGYICPSTSTCRTSGACEPDPQAGSSAFQCNKTTGGASACYDDNGVFKNPAPAGCYATWGKCNANSILKVRKDRGCNLWLSCATTIQTEPKPGAPAENLCLTLAACNSLNQQGQCNSYLPQGQCNNDPLRFCGTDVDCLAGGSCNLSASGQPTQSLQDLTFRTPDDVEKIANLSGSVIGGLDWNQIGGSTVLQGSLPWQLMQQVGGDSVLTNGDMEYNPPHEAPWQAVPVNVTPQKNIAVVLEDQNVSINHVLNTDPIKTISALRCSNSPAKTCTVNADCTTPAPVGTCVDTDVAVEFSGVATDTFTTVANELYYAEARIRANDATPTIRVQFGHNGYNNFTTTANGATVNTFVDIKVTSAWQRVTLGPLQGMSGATRLGFVCANAIDCDRFEIDDVIIKPVLQINTNPAYITPSCRLYPKDDSPSCDYVDTNGVMYKGWKGYCLENDSATATCLSWWPVDIIRGETSVFGADKAAGYNDRAPLYICAETTGTRSLPSGSGFTLGDTFTAPFCESSNESAQTPSSLFPGTPGGLCGVARGPYLPMTTVVNDDIAIAFNNCNDIENVAACRNNQQPGFCFCQGGGGSARNDPDKDGWVDASTTDQQIHKYEVDHFRMHILRYNRTDGDANNGSSWNHLVTGDIILNEGNNWSANNKNSACAGTSIQLDWDPNDGHLRRIYHYSARCASGGFNDEAMSGFFAVGLFYTKDQCTKIVQVVKDNGENKAFSARVKSSAYKVPDLGYGLGSDLTPFGALLQPNIGSSPTDWPILSVEAPNSTNLSGTTQARAGSPYACVGTCGQMLCNVRNDLICAQNGAVNNASVIQCQNILGSDGSTPIGQCLGTPTVAASKLGGQLFSPTHPPEQVTGAANNPYFAQERIRRLFAQSYGVWTWSKTLDRYVLDPNSDPSTVDSNFVGWRSPSTICPVGPSGKLERPDYEPSHNDYCAVPPQILEGSAKFLTGTSSVVTITGGSGSVGLKFNTQADTQQVPLESFNIDWGNRVTPLPYRYAPRNDPANPHIFSNVYSNTGPTCSSANQKNCCTITNGRKTCNYEIRLQVKDNWGWCNNASATDKCPADPSTWYDTGLTVRVEP